MTDIAPIYIASKGRATKQHTLALLEDAGLSATLVVEPQDEAAYRAAHPDVTLHVLPENDRGLAYVRNFILDLNEGAFWMLDDDFRGFYVRLEQRMHHIAADVALRGTQRKLRKLGVAVGAMEYQQFAWSSTHEYVLNTHCDCCTYIDATQITFERFNESLVLKADREFVVQVLSNGKRTARVTRYGFAAPATGSNAGGQQAAYDDDNTIRDSVQRFARMYPHIVKPVRKRNGRLDARINWSYFKQQ